MISVNNYTAQPWNKIFPKEVDIGEIPIFSKWKDYFGQLNEHGSFKNINSTLMVDIEDEASIYPYPKLLYKTFNDVELDDIKVVFVGQDPYFSAETRNGIKIPQAMGASFSVPVGMNIPSSLQNIFKNQMDNKIIETNQPHGNLQFWMSQGCFLLNTALTVRNGEASSHCNVWKPVTDKLIKHISTELPEVIFVLWGSYAYNKNVLIDVDKHNIVVSSHPSGLSCNKGFGNFPAFSQYNHFKTINDMLVKSGRDEIVWQLF